MTGMEGNSPKAYLRSGEFFASEYQVCKIFFQNIKNLMLKSSIKSSIIDKKYYFKWGSLPFFENTGQKG